MVSSLARSSSMPFWSLCSSSLSARTLEMMSRRSSSAEQLQVLLGSTNLPLHDAQFLLQVSDAPLRRGGIGLHA
eukprot:CAMPEP_0175315388 /NCGR_PEP_ID=MMETSP0093-20121207/68873_1 /TAXON_ID=311494 /ORGANISM="Alexandrium monilatum, Strain CCMP3105" /LENGTH=73 /DNA_ID=CAMNT_0016612123 /DNA_START=198 /DNA_END=415 /DNA_ORIENTATION=+